MEATETQRNTPFEESVSMNTTANGSSSWSCSRLINPVADKIGQTIAYNLILLSSLVGNSLIVLIVYKTPALRKPINMLIANMAMSDLLFPIFLFPVRLSELHVGSWLIGGNLGQALCKIHVFLSDVSTLVSIQSLVLISVERFGAVVVPLRPPFINRKLCPYLIVGSWILAVAFFSPYLFAFKLVEYPEGMWCELQWEEAFGETNSLFIHDLVEAIVFFCIPVVLLVILYTIILIKLKQKVHPGEQSANIEEQQTRRNKKVLKMAIAINLAFFICWAPLLFDRIIYYFAPDLLSSCIVLVYYFVVPFITYANCVINPIICLMFSNNYRHALKRLVRCCDAVQE